MLADSTRLAPATLLAALLVVAAAGPARTQPVECPVAPDPAALPDAAALRKMNAFVDKLGARPTGSRSHARYVDWIRRELRKIPGVEVTELPYPIDRWSAKRAKLTMTVRTLTGGLPIQVVNVQFG